MATVIIPTPLRKFTSNTSRIIISGSTVQEVIENLNQAYPDVRKHIQDNSGAIRPFINIFVGEDDIRTLDSHHTQVHDESFISIIPAIAGGNAISE
ncbi:MAG: MoaD/ThiS family protein [Arcticibacter sp.]